MKLLPVAIRNYRLTAKDADLRPLARRYLRLWLATIAVQALLYPVWLPIAAVWLTAKGIDKAIEWCVDRQFPWFRLFNAYEQLGLELRQAYQEKHLELSPVSRKPRP